MPSRKEIERVGLAALHNAGVPHDHAEKQLSLLLDAELSGFPSHGLRRLPRVLERIGNGVTDPCEVGAAQWRASAFLEVDGRQGLGPVVALKALEQAGARARATGVAIAAIRNCDHLGMLAWYAERVASAGQLLLAFTVSEALVHPWGGRRAMIGTNPVSIGVPTTERPFVFDMATSTVAMGKIHDFAARGEPIPEGWALDGNGDPTTDAEAAKTGAIAPFGGAKGYALGLAFEVLVGALTGCALGDEVKGTLDSTAPCNKGDLFIVVEPRPEPASAVSVFLDAIRSTDPADPAHPVRVPGDRASTLRLKAEEADIPLDPELWSHLVSLAKTPELPVARPFAS